MWLPTKPGVPAASPVSASHADHPRTTTQRVKGLRRRLETGGRRDSGIAVGCFRLGKALLAAKRLSIETSGISSKRNAETELMNVKGKKDYEV